ncbi:MAG: hypothetical protein ABFE01_04545 [Phycisphaerales bacterium]|jgi:hypothetical protein
MATTIADIIGAALLVIGIYLVLGIGASLIVAGIAVLAASFMATRRAATPRRAQL